MSFIARFRFLPAVIFAAALMLTVKLGTIWQGFDGILTGSISVATVRAQQAQPQPAQAQPKPAQAQPKPQPQAKAQPKAQPQSKTEGPKQAPTALRPAEVMPADKGAGAAEGDKESAAASLLNNDPTLLTQTEIDLLQQLSERREKLEARERELEMRTGLLNAAETRINSKIEDLKRLQDTIEGLIKKYDDQQTAKMQSLVKIYQNMKPKDAARIFEELDMDTLLAVAELMNERKLAPIMAKMNPDKAKDMTVELTRLRELPKPGTPTGG